MFCYDDWVGRVPPSLCIDNLIQNVAHICTEDGVMLDSFVQSHWAYVLRKHALHGFAISSPMTGWIGDPAKNTFYQFNGRFRGINDDDHEKRFELFVIEGYYDKLNEGITEGDRYEDIRLSPPMIQLAIDNVRNGAFILHTYFGSVV